MIYFSKIININFNKLIQGLGSVDKNLNNINVLGDKIAPLINQFQNSEISDLSVKRINFLTEQLSQANFQDFNAEVFHEFVYMLNQTLYNLNNALIQIRNPFFKGNFQPTINPEFNPSFNPKFNSRFNNIESDEISTASTPSTPSSDSSPSVNTQDTTTPTTQSISSGSSSGISPFIN